MSAVITHNPDAATSRALRAVLEGHHRGLVSPALIDEWQRILRESDKREQHGLDDPSIEALIADTVAQCTLVVPATAPEVAPDPDDQHVWNLLMDPTHTTVLVTVDRRLLENPPRGYIVVSPGEFVRRYLPPDQVPTT